MKRLWSRETLRFVDAWACREGTPEDEEDRKNGVNVEEGRGGGTGSGERSESEKADIEGGEVEGVMVGVE